MASRDSCAIECQRNGRESVTLNQNGTLTVNNMTASIVMTGFHGDDDESESSSSEEQQSHDVTVLHPKIDVSSVILATSLTNDSLSNSMYDDGGVSNDLADLESPQVKRKALLTRTRSRPVSEEDRGIADSVITIHQSLTDGTVGGPTEHLQDSPTRVCETETTNSSPTGVFVSEHNSVSPGVTPVTENSSGMATGAYVSEYSDGREGKVSVPEHNDDSPTGVSVKARLMSDSQVQTAIQKNTRFNPFNRDTLDNDNTDSISFCSDMSRNTSVSGLSDIDDYDVIITEDYFSIPEGHLSEKSIPDLKLSVHRVKEMIMSKQEKTQERRQLVKKLVHLRLKLAELMEEPPDKSNIKPILGHKFVERTSRSSKHFCEKCNSVIWGVIQAWYRCTDCGYTSHGKCLNQTVRPCASVKVSQHPVYVKKISPESSLSSQKYKCHECRTPISFHRNYGEPRLCDYNGLWYCELCHWNDSMVIPARVLHNWDFEPRKICRASKQFLKLMAKKAVLNVQEISPTLFSFVEELNQIKCLRKEILQMKKYFLSCKSALESKILLQLQHRQHFVDSSHMYSLQDLRDTERGALVPELEKIHQSFAHHITKQCQLCQAKGFVCELCNSSELLFPFLRSAEVCPNCKTVLHKRCLSTRNVECPKCLRWETRRSVES